ncbi:MAG TPA: TetR/AcrR family transcriptional regulator [Clostridiaceae bacterium]|nr:TetR/AcrR family transcriptional regulator [Clostridiaceae bacterium]
MAMSEEKRNKIAKQRRKQILEAALQLFLEYGYTNTTVQDIADKAGISKGLIYRYFDSKNDILEAESELIERCEIECKNQPTAVDALRTYAMRVLSDVEVSGYFPPLRNYIACYLEGCLSESMRERYFSNTYGRTYFGDLMKRGQEEGDIIDGDPQALGTLFWNYLLGATAQYLRTPDDKRFDPNFEKILELFLKK